MQGWGGMDHEGVGWVGHVGWGGVGHVGVGWGGSCRVGGSCRGGVGQTWPRYLTAPPPVGHYKGKHDYKMHIYHDHKKFFTLQPQNKGLGTSRGQIYVLPMTWRMEALGPPFGRHAALRLFHYYWLVLGKINLHRLWGTMLC